MSLYQPWSLTELVADLSSGATTPAAAVERALSRIAETDDAVQAWVGTGRPEISAPLGPLAGVPVGVKDIIDLRGFPTRCGSQLRATIDPADTDAIIVSAWRTTGAVPLGKTVTTEFAFFSPGSTSNPTVPGHTPGGSSSGSAAAVAAGQVPLALGSQTAGSVTRPASFCGVAALVMSHGRYATDGVVGLSPSLDSHGFFAAGARDLGVAWSALSGETIAAASTPRILLWDASTLGDLSDDMAGAIDRAAATLRTQGAEVEDFADSALIAEAAAAHVIVMSYEAARERSAELAQAEQLSVPLRGLLETGAVISDADYAEASALVGAARERLRATLADGTRLLGAGALGAAPAGMAATGDPLLSRPWQALGLPVVSIPGLRDSHDRPLGVQLVGAALSETRLLGHAEWVQQQIS